MQRLLALGTAEEVLETRAFRAFALGDREAWKRVTRELMDHPPEVPAVTALQVATYLDDVDGAERFAHPPHGAHPFGRCPGHGPPAARPRGGGPGAVERGAGAAGLRPSLRSHGRAGAALAAGGPAVPLACRAPSCSRSGGTFDQWRAAIEAPGESSHSAAHTGLHPYIRRYRLGLLDTRLGDTTSAVRLAGSLEQAADSAIGLKADALRTFALSIRARVAGQAGRAAEALEYLDRSRWQVVESIFEAEALDRYYRAELLFALGRHAEALDWYRTIAERATYELVYVAPARWREGWLYHRIGDEARAAGGLPDGRATMGRRGRAAPGHCRRSRAPIGQPGQPLEPPRQADAGLPRVPFPRERALGRSPLQPHARASAEHREPRR